MHRDLRLAVCAGACALVALGVQPGETAPGRGQETTPAAFPSQVAVVTVDAVVVDGNGQSVEGLTKDDFVLEEDGKPQTIVNFEAVSLPPEAAGGATAPAEPGPIVTNEAADTKTGRAFALLADDLSFPGDQSGQIRQTLTRFINESLGPGDTAIVATTSGDTSWKERVPEGRADLLAVVDRIKGRFADPRMREHMTEYEAYWITHREGGIAQRSEQLTDAMQRPSSVSERVVLRLWEEDLCGQKGGANHPPSADSCWPIMRATATDIDAARSQRTSQALQAMSRTLGALSPSRGRKSLVFVSPGFIQDNDLALQDMASAALQAHTSLYFVDVRGLVAETGGGSAAERTRQSPAPDRKTTARLEDLELASGGAQALAEQTGGFSVKNTNDLAGATKRIAAESRTFYMLGFSPPTGKAPNAWRKLRVEVKRSGVTTRALRGYRLDQATAAAMARTGTGTTIPIRMATYVLEPSGPDRTRVVAVTEIDTSGVAANANPGDDTPTLELRVEATPRDGGDTQAQDVSLQSPRANPQAAARPGAAWRLARLEFSLPSGVHAIRAFVHDPASGRSGVVEQRLGIPASSGLRLSTPVLSDLVTASRDASGIPFPAPVAHDVFKPDPARPLLVTVEAFGAAKDAASGKTDVASRLVLQTRGGKALAAPPAASLATAPDGRLRQVVALPQLPGGEYELAIAMEDRVAKARQEVRRTFTVDAPNAPATPAAPVASVSAAPP